MKTPERFERAVTKLYNAFHDGKLEAGNCTKCAIGNMCDNKMNWSDLFITATDRDEDGNVKSRKVLYAEENELVSRDFFGNYNTFFLDPRATHASTNSLPPVFLLPICGGKEASEKTQLERWRERRKLAEETIAATGYNQAQLAAIEQVFERTVRTNTKEDQFKGLCAVIDLLCQIEGIPNVMDYKKLFEYENEEVKPLSEVF